MIKFYSTHCPKCKVVEAKLSEKNIKYQEIDDMEEMQKVGLKSVPALEVNGELLDFGKAVQWIRNYTGE